MTNLAQRHKHCDEGDGGPGIGRETSKGAQRAGRLGAVARGRSAELTSANSPHPAQETGTGMVSNEAGRQPGTVHSQL